MGYDGDGVVAKQFLDIERGGAIETIAAHRAAGRPAPRF
jgi:hypothetical protein